MGRKAWYWAVLSSLALFTGVVGLHDLLYAADLGSRILAAFFIATCIVSVASLIGIARHRFWGLQAGIITGLFGTLGAASLLLFQYVGGDVDWRIGVWLAGAALCLSVAIFASIRGEQCRGQCICAHSASGDWAECNAYRTFSVLVHVNSRVPSRLHRRRSRSYPSARPDIERFYCRA